jgi:hypothetical protein
MCADDGDGNDDYLKYHWLHQRLQRRDQASYNVIDHKFAP